MREKVPIRIWLIIVGWLFCALEGRATASTTLTNEVSITQSGGQFSFARFAGTRGALQRVELDYFSPVTIGDFVVRNSTSSGQFVRVIFTNLYKLTAPQRTITLGGALFGCGYVDSKSEVRIPPEERSDTFRTSTAIVWEGDQLTNFLGAGTVRLDLTVSAVPFVYIREIRDCSRVLNRAAGISADVTSYTETVTVTLRYVYETALRISSFTVEQANNTIHLAWSALPGCDLSYVVEKSDDPTSGNWTLAKTVAPGGEDSIESSLDFNPTKSEFFRIRAE